MGATINTQIITFDTTAKMEVLSFFDKTVDSDGYLIEAEDPTQKVITPDGEEIPLEKFAGIRKGSEIYLKNDLPSLIELLDIISS